MNFKFISILLVSILLGCNEPANLEYDLIIINGNTIDLSSGNLEQQDIFIIDGIIQKVEKTKEANSYNAKNIIDAKNKYILPGFWDNHVHFRGGDSLIDANKNLLKLYIANGITTVRDAGGDLVSSVMKWRTQISENKLIGPTIFTSGPKIDGPSGTWAGSLAVDNEEDIGIALDSIQRIGVDFVKLYDSRIDGNLYLKTLKEARNRNLISSGHMPLTVSLDKTIAAGINSIEHLYYIMKGCSANEAEITERYNRKEIGFWQAMPLLRTSYQDSAAQQTFRTLKENEVYVVPTLHIGEVLSYLDEVDHSNDSYLNYMGEGITKTYEGRINRALNATEKAIQDRKDLDVFFGQLTNALNDAGVNLLAGSDCGAYNSFIYPGISLHKELDAMVRCGLSPLQALRTSAYNGSKFLRQDKALGNIKEDMVSDLVLLESNPLEDIKNTTKIDYVIKAEQVFDKQGLQSLLDNAIAN